MRGRLGQWAGGGRCGRRAARVMGTARSSPNARHCRAHPAHDATCCIGAGVINCVGHLRESALRRSLFLEVVGLQGVTTKLGFGKECVLDYSAISVCKARPTKRR